MRKTVSCTMLFLLVMSTFGMALKTQPASAADIDWWPMFHHDLTHTGYSTSTAPPTNQILWKHATGGSVWWSSPAVTDGIVYVAPQSNVCALNSSTGALIWSYGLGTSVQSSPTVAGGIVYVGSSNGNVYALNSSTGALIWSYVTGSNVWLSSPAVAGGIVYVAPDNGNIYALKASTGTLIWSYTTGGSLGYSPAVSGGIVYGSGDDAFYALDASTGTQIWKFTTGSYVGSSSPAVAGGVVYVGSDNGNVYALNAFTGALVWSYATGSSVQSSPAVGGGIVYVGSDNSKVYALKASTGTLIWSYTTGGYVLSSPAVAGGVVYVGSGGSVYALDASKGALKWSYTTGGGVDSSPAVVGGIVYVGSGDGNVYAFGSSPGEQTLTLNVNYGGIIYGVSLVVPPMTYQTVLNGATDSAPFYPNFDQATLATVFYVNDYVNFGSSTFPILQVTITLNGQTVTDSGTKQSVLDGLLEYCFLTTQVCSTNEIQELQTDAQLWTQDYKARAYGVNLEERVSTALYWLTIIGPLIDDVKSLFGATTSKQVQDAVSLFYDVIGGFQSLTSSYGSDKANSIVQILQNHNLVQSSSYQPSSLCLETMQNPDSMVKALSEIESSVFGSTMTSKAQSIMSATIDELPLEVIDSFSEGTAVGLYAYFSSELSASTSIAIGATAALENFVGYGVPLALAGAISEGYLQPTANAFYDAWTYEGDVGELYQLMSLAASNMANPALIRDALDLNQAIGLFNIYGALEVMQACYYMESYQYATHVRTTAADLSLLMSDANAGVYNAKQWQSVGQSILDETSSLMSVTDPNGISFQFLYLSPSLNAFPPISAGNGVCLSVSTESYIQLADGSLSLTVQDGNWSSNFPSSIMFDDSAHDCYIIIVNPPDGEYSIETNGLQNVSLTSFAPATDDNITLTQFGEVYGSNFAMQTSSKSSFITLESLSVLTSKTVVGQGYALCANVTIANAGDLDETLDMTMLSNGTVIGTESDVKVANGTSSTCSFIWNTTGLGLGKYTMSALAGTLSASSSAIVTIPGDVNGDFKVSLLDLVLLANAYSTRGTYNPAGTGLHQWNPNADINGDDVVDLADLTLLAIHYRQHYP